MGRLVVYTAPIATGASHTNSVNLGQGEFNRFCVYLPSGPTDTFITEAVDINFQGSVDGGTTWHTIGYSNNPATATSGFRAVEAGRNSFGSAVICEAALFATDFRVKFSTACTVGTDAYYVVAGKD